MSEYSIDVISKRATDLSKADEFAQWSKVEIVNGDNTFTAGNDTGRTLTVESPFGSQAMADNILSSIAGKTYQPFTATGARISPAAELGDGISVGSVYGGIYSQDIRFGADYVADVSAPGESAIDHEIPYTAPERRKTDRQINAVRSFASGGMAALRQDLEEQVEHAYNECIAEIQDLSGEFNDLSSGLRAYVDKQDDGTWKATATFYAAVNDSVASITASVQNVNGRYQSLASMIADFVNIKSKYTNMESVITTASGQLTVGGSITCNGAGVYCADGIMSCKTLKVGGSDYSDQEITSTSGVRHALGR